MLMKFFNKKFLNNLQKLSKGKYCPVFAIKRAFYSRQKENGWLN